jgi:lysophospholipase L1-like esterase
LFALALGTVAALVLAELVLQAGALVVRGSSGPGEDAWLTGNRRVLCLGDSNTRGLFVKREESYPKQLEQLWNAAHEDAPIEVLNVSWSGVSSSRLLHELPRLLQVFDPELVIVLIGNNDYWTEPVQVESGQPAGGEESLIRHSRLYKLFFMLARSLEYRELEVTPQPTAPKQAEGSAIFRYGEDEFSLGFEMVPKGLRLPDADVQRSLYRNLAAIAQEVEAASARLIFLTYPSRERRYGMASAMIARAAMATATPLVDVADVAKEACPQEPCPKWFLADSHPRAPIYRLMAEEIVSHLSGY